MTIEVQAGYIHVRFDHKDWKMPNRGARLVIDCIKTEIGHISKNPDGFDYNENDLTWIIKDSEHNRLVLESAKEQYIDEPNQEKLFL